MTRTEDPSGWKGGRKRTIENEGGRGQMSPKETGEVRSFVTPRPDRERNMECTLIYVGTFGDDMTSGRHVSDPLVPVRVERVPELSLGPGRGPWRQSFSKRTGPRTPKAESSSLQGVRRGVRHRGSKGHRQVPVDEDTRDM